MLQLGIGDRGRVASDGPVALGERASGKRPREEDDDLPGFCRCSALPCLSHFAILLPLLYRRCEVRNCLHHYRTPVLSLLLSL